MNGKIETPVHNIGMTAKEKRRTINAWMLGSAFTLMFTNIAWMPYVHAAQTGGTVVGGTGSISQSGTNTTINQTSQNMAIDWQTYNVNVDERVQYIQPNRSSISLNRILGNSASQIRGRIDANGQVILVNPNGVFFTPTATINVGGIIASGLDIKPSDFMNGDFIFSEVAGTDGKVVNSGVINAAVGGNVALIGKQVQNDGLIQAKLGSVNLAAGKEAVLTFDNLGLVGVKVTKEILQDELGVDPAVVNSGKINAEGGRVLLTASVSQDVFSQAVNANGLDQASSVVVHPDGTFTLGGGADVINTGSIDVSITEDTGSALVGDTNVARIILIGENVTSSGTIKADNANGDGGEIELHANDTILLTGDSVTSASSKTNGKGGIVKVLGDKVGLFDQTKVDVSGDLGGGQAYIGGDYLGSNPLLRNATTTSVSSNTSIYADALTNGDGGKVILWSDDTTYFGGNIYTRGGSESGDGGFIETSGKMNLIFRGNTDRSAVNGQAGTLLLDPNNIDIGFGGGDDFELFDNQILFFDGGGVFDISPDIIAAQLDTGDVILQAETDITVLDNIIVNPGNINSLELSAGDDIFVEFGTVIDMFNGDITLTAGAECSGCNNITPHDVTIDGQIVTTGNVFINAADDIILNRNISGNFITIRSGDDIVTSPGSNIDAMMDVSLMASDDTLIFDGIAVPPRTAVGSINLSGFIAANNFFASTSRGSFRSNGFTFTSGNADIVADRAVLLGDFNVNGDMNVTSVTRDITQENNNSILNVFGNTTFTADGPILLDNNSIFIDGLVSFNTPFDVLFVNNAPVTTIGDSNIGGIFDVTAAQDLRIMGIINNDTFQNYQFGMSGLPSIFDTTGANFVGFTDITVTGNFGDDTLIIDVAGVQNSGIFDVFAGAGNDNIILLSGIPTIPINIDGGPGIDTITGGDMTNNWMVNGMSQGVLNGNIFFTSTDTMVGGNLDDTFNLTTFGRAAGYIDGGGGAGFDVINFTGGTNRTVQIGTQFTAATDVIGFEQINGEAGMNNTLIGDNQLNNWEINGIDSGTINGAGFVNFSNLTGNNNDDIFTYVAGSITGLVNGGLEATGDFIDLSAIPFLVYDVNSGGPFSVAGIEGVQGDGSTSTLRSNGIFATTWNISDFDGAGTLSDGVNDGIVSDAFNSTLFIDFSILQGNNANDTFNVSTGSSIDTIQGGGGVNTLNGRSDVPSVWNITGFGTGNVTYVANFSNIQTINAGTNIDTFNMTGNFAGTINAGGNNDVLNILSNQTTTFNAGAGNDVYNISANSNGQLNAGSGNDRFNIMAGGLFIANINGGSGNDEIAAFDENNYWLINGTNSGTISDFNPFPFSIGINRATFVGVENMSGGRQADYFAMQGPTASFTGNINGGDGNPIPAQPADVFDVSAWTAVDTRIPLSRLFAIERIEGGGNATLELASNGTNTWVIDGLNSGQVNGQAFSGFSNIMGGTGIDNFLIDGGSLNGTLDGGFTNLIDTNTYNSLEIAGFGNTTWTINNLNSGSVTDVPSGFFNIQNLNGGGGNDRFNFQANGAITGTVNGGPGGNNILDMAPVTAALNVRLGNDLDFTTMDVIGVDEIRGNNHISSRLYGELNTASSYSIQRVFDINSNLTDGLNDGIVNGAITYENFHGLYAGNLDDTITLSANGRTNGVIHGGGGTNTITNITNNSSSWFVSLPNDGAALKDAVGYGFFNIQNLNGGAGDDTLTISGAGSVENFNGGGGFNAINMLNTADRTWTLDSTTGGGTTGITNFTGVNQIDAGSGINTFEIVGAFTGTINGNTNDDIFNIRVDNTATSNGLTGTDTFNIFASVNPGGALNGGDGDDLFIFNGAGLDVDSLIGGDTGEVLGDSIQAFNENNYWAITDPDIGTISDFTGIPPSVGAQRVSFDGIENMAGGTASDYFFMDGVTADITGNINGGVGPGDYFDVSNWGATAAIPVGRMAEIEDLIGGGSGTFNASGAGDIQWIISGSNSGTVQGMNFTGFSTLNGSDTGNDTFILRDNGVITGNINGRGGINTMETGDVIIGDSWDVSNTWNISGNGIGSVVQDGDVNSLTTFSNIWNLTGGEGVDAFSVSTSGVIGNINGGGGLNRIATTGLSARNWTIDSPVSGSITGAVSSFTNMDTVTGGAGGDTFNINANFSGIINGDDLGGSGTDTFNISTSTAFTGTINGRGGGDIFNLNMAMSSGTLNGNNGDDIFNLNAIMAGTINGDDGSDVFNVNLANTVTGTINGNLGQDQFWVLGDVTTGILNGNEGNDTFEIFAGINIINAGTGADTINVNAAMLSGTINGEAGIDTFNIADLMTNTINGGDDGDIFNIQTGSDVSGILNGEAGMDEFNIDASIITGILNGGIDNDTFNISADVNDLNGGFGDDTFNVVGNMNLGFLNGDEGIDNFIITAQMNGFINGGNGNDNIIVDTGGILSGIANGDLGLDQFNVINGLVSGTLNGGDDNDTITISGSLTGTVNAGAGNDILLVSPGGIVSGNLNGDAGDDRFDYRGTVSGTSSGGLDDDTFFTRAGSNVSGLISGDVGLDTFNLFADAWLINGGAGDDSFVVNGALTNAILNGEAGNDSFSINAAVNIANGGAGIDSFSVNAATTGTLSGGADGDTFALNANVGVADGGTGDDTFTITSTVSGQIRGLAGNDTYNIFAAVTADLNGGSGDDTFNINANVANVNGGAGIDTFNINSDITGIINGDTGDDFFDIAASVNTVNGGFGFDTFNVSSAQGSGILNGDGDSDTFNISASMGGTINGGDANDIININNNGNISGTANGNAGDDDFVISDNVSGILNGNAGSDDFTFQVSNLTVNNINGGSGDDFINAALQNNNWVVTSINRGRLNTNTDFNSIENLIGNGGVDTFTLNSNITGLVDGAANNDVFNINGAMSGVVIGGDGLDSFTITADTSGLITGDAGNDTFDIRANVTSLFGGADNDTFNVSGSGSGAINGDEGDDELNVTVTNINGSSNILFAGGTGINTVNIQGGGANYAGAYTANVISGPFTYDQIIYTQGANQFGVLYREVIDVVDQSTTPVNYTINGTAGDDLIVMDSGNPVEIGSRAPMMLENFRVNGGVPVFFENKTSLSVDGMAGTDRVEFNDNVNLGGGDLVLNVETLDITNGSVDYQITANQFTLNGLQAMVSQGGRLLTDINMLSINNSNAIRITDSGGDGFAINNLNTTGLLDIIAAGQISGSGLVYGGDLTINTTGIINLTGANQLSGVLNLNASNVTLFNEVDTNLIGTMNVLDATIANAILNATGNFGDATIRADNGANLTGTMNSLDATVNNGALNASGDLGNVIVRATTGANLTGTMNSLDATVTNGALNASGDLGNVIIVANGADLTGTVNSLDATITNADLTATGNFGNVIIRSANDATITDSNNLIVSDANLNGVLTTTSNGLEVGTITAGEVNLNAGTGAITDFNGDTLVNIIANRTQLRARTGIGTIQDAIETQTGELDVVNVGAGNSVVNIVNNGNTFIRNLVNNGDVYYANRSGNVTIDRIDADFNNGELTMTVENGSVIGYQNKNYNAFPDITARSTTIQISNGDFGERERPISVHVQDRFFLNASNSYVLYPTTPPGRIEDVSAFQFHLFGFGLLSGEEMIVVESLSEVDPAIFTAVRNYDYPELAVMLPSNQSMTAIKDKKKKLEDEDEEEKQDSELDREKN